MKLTANPIRDPHAVALSKASYLSGFQGMDALQPKDVAKVLNDSRIKFVLVGAYGLSGWMQQARATEDVDVVVGAKQQKMAVGVLSAAFPHLVPEDHEVVVRLRDPETKEVAIDIIKANQPLIKAVLKNTQATEVDGVPVLVPTLEMGLALKFARMISLTRADDKKYMDAHDFIRTVKKNSSIDLETLAELGDLVYPGGGKQLLEKVETVRAGKKLQV